MLLDGGGEEHYEGEGNIRGSTLHFTRLYKGWFMIDASTSGQIHVTGKDTPCRVGCVFDEEEL